MRFKVYQAQTKTFDEAVAVAIQREAFQQADKHRSRRYVCELEVVAPTSPIDDTVRDVAAVSKQSDKVSNSAIMDQLESLTKIVRELQTRRPVQDYSKFTCWNCGEKGHTKTYCTKPRLDLFGFYVAFNTVQVISRRVRVLYCKLPTNGKQLPAFPLTAMTGIDPRPQRWEARVLPLCHRGPSQGLIKRLDSQSLRS